LLRNLHGRRAKIQFLVWGTSAAFVVQSIRFLTKNLQLFSTKLILITTTPNEFK